ncbi:GIN domain-containing protein [Massilia sp. Se16.2.3]|uniref:GIN domain-containing protein n=1 Tax=Massilia sp. Se16.2.3 TaxID=2709303 RepID=UPI001E3690EA|nr:DUF2807 domain-containing protein [Massilia sp. Se16.2.3]
MELTLPALDRVAVDGSSDTVVNGFSGERIEVELNGSGSIVFNGRYRQAHAAVQGSGDLTLDAGNGDEIEARLSGSGSLTLAGAARSVSVESDGSGTLDAQRLRAERVKVRQTGSGNTSVTARETPGRLGQRQRRCGSVWRAVPAQRQPHRQRGRALRAVSRLDAAQAPIHSNTPLPAARPLAKQAVSR